MTTFAIVCLCISFFLFSGYVIELYIKYKPSCISETYYWMKHKWAFTAWIIAVSFLIFPAWVEISPVMLQFLPFLSVVALGSVGVNPRYLGSERTAHLVSAALAIAISLIWNIVTGIYIVPIILGIIISVLAIFRTKNLLFWGECAAFLNIYLSIIFS